MMERKEFKEIGHCGGQFHGATDPKAGAVESIFRLLEDRGSIKEVTAYHDRLVLSGELVVTAGSSRAPEAGTSMLASSRRRA